MYSFQLTDEQQARLYLHEAKDLFNANMYKEALIAANKSMEICTLKSMWKCDGALSIRASCYSHLGKINEALADYDVLVEKKQSYKLFVRRSHLLQLHKGRWLLYIASNIIGDLEGALSDFKTAAVMNPRDRVTWNNMAALYNAMEQYEKYINGK